MLLLLTAVIASVCVAPVYSQLTGLSPVPYVSPDSCIAGVERFQDTTLRCVPCAANESPSQDGLRCSCDRGYIQPIGSQDCIECTNETVTSRDGLFCLSCDTGYNPTTRECNECPGGRTHVFLDSLPITSGAIGSRACVQCPTGTWSDDSGFVCVPCGLDDCSQCSAIDVFGGVCFTTTPPSPPNNAFSYYQEHFGVAAQLCMDDGNLTACQLLANLCVLQLYNRGDQACLLSQQISADLLQPIYYPPQSADELLERPDIQTPLVAGSILPLMIGAYSLNGTFLGLSELTDQTLLCRDLSPRVDAVWRVGVQYQVECTVRGADLMTGATSPLFYEIYLRDSDTLYPVPVLITNYRSPIGEAINEGTDVGSWQFVRRFFLYESVTSSPLYTSSTCLKVLVHDGGQLSVPYLTLTYSQWTVNQDRLPASHTSEYDSAGQSFLIVLCVLAALCPIMGGIYSGLKVNGFLRRTGQTCCDPHTMIYAVVMFSHCTSTLLCVLLTATSVFWLILYKAQYHLLLPLPDQSEELAFQVILGLTLLFRVLHVLYLVWHQCTVDVFFIDWEKPRMQLTNQNTDGSQTTPPNMLSTVSIWRTYFVVNEWNELQSLRKLNNTLLAAMTLLFVQVVGLEHLAESDPASNVTSDPSCYSAPFSPILRFSIVAIFYSLFAALLRGYMFLIYERYFEHKLRQFVDLCSVANVSLLVLSRQLYGHYVHGKSVHGHADTDMRQMNHNFKKEQEDMCGRRGLEGDSDDQLFEVLLTQSFRTHYDKIVQPMRAEQSSGVGVSEAGLKAHGDMTYYLTTFIEHGLKDVDYCVGVKSAMERLIGIEFYDVLDKSLFYKSSRYSFEDVLFYGCEWSLYQLDLLLFGLLGTVSNSYPLAAVLTLLISWLVMVIRDFFGRRNIANKTLVDDRFLL